MDGSGHHLKRRVAARQARVGIIANPKSVELPQHAPRDVWTRWPKLRSGRRQDHAISASEADQAAPDPVLSGEALKNFTRELRSSDLAPPGAPASRPSFADRLSFLSPVDTGRLVRRLALGLLVVAIALIALSLTGV